MTDRPDYPPPLPPPIPPLPGEPGGAWERPGPFFTRLLETTRGVLIEPQAFFATMPRSGGLWPPLFYYLLLAAASFLVNLVFQATWGSLGGRDAEGLLALPCMIAVGIVVGPILLTLGCFIGAAIYHVLLVLLNGATEGYEATFRVVAYASGATGLVSVVPFCGWLVAWIWNIVVMIVGLREVHRTTTGKAAGAVLIPAVVCCGIVIAVISAVGIAAVLGGIAAATYGR